MANDYIYLLIQEKTKCETDSLNFAPTLKKRDQEIEHLKAGLRDTHDMISQLKDIDSMVPKYDGGFTFAGRVKKYIEELERVQGLLNGQIDRLVQEQDKHWLKIVKGSRRQTARESIRLVNSFLSDSYVENDFNGNTEYFVYTDNIADVLVKHFKLEGDKTI
jgi:hypothetical protein